MVTCRLLEKGTCMVASVEDLGPQDGSANRFLEVMAAALLGLAAVAIGLSSYQSALWGGVQDTALTQSVLTSNDEIDQLQLGDTTRATDQALFISMLTSEACGDFDDLLSLNLEPDFSPCGQIILGLSDGAVDAIKAWQDDDELYPFDALEYELSLSGEETAKNSQDFFDEAARANKNGDEYELASTFVTIVMFLAGISFVLSATRIRWALIAGSTALLVGSAAYLASLSWMF